MLFTGYPFSLSLFFLLPLDTNPSISGNSKILKFNLSLLSVSEKIVSIQLVLKQSNHTTLTYGAELYEMIGESRKQSNLLDSGEYSGQWHTLQVQGIEDSVTDGVRRNYNLALYITSSDGEAAEMQDILRTIKPMLLVYTNDLDWMATEMEMEVEKKGVNEESSHFGDESWQAKNKRAKRTTDGSANPAEPTLGQMALLSCRKQVAPPRTLQMLWETYTIISPFNLKFSFCYGTCNSPLSTPLVDQYNNHAKLRALIAPGTPPITPCCIHNQTTTIQLIYQSVITGIVSTTSYVKVVSCRCM